MATIECKLGPTEQTVAGSAYSFQRDAYGRYTCRVDRVDDIKCFLAVEHYRQVDDVPPEHEAPADFIDPGFSGEDLDDDDKPDDAGDDEGDDDDDGAPDLSFDASALGLGGAPLQPAGTTTIPGTAQTAPAITTTLVPDDLTKIAGIGPKVQEKLAVVGITTFQQIADLQPADIEKLNEQLKLFGAITTKDWIGQAKALLPPKVETLG